MPPRGRATVTANQVRTRLLSLVATAALAACSGTPTASPPTPPPSPTFTPFSARGPIPAGKPVVIYRVAGAPVGDLAAASWDGVLYRGPNAPVVGPDRASPDGSKVAFGIVVEELASGALTRLPADGNTLVRWGDDSQHLCLSKPTGGEGSPRAISIVLPGAPAIALASLGATVPQAPGPTILACSPLSSRVVVAQIGPQNDTQEVWVLNATTGALQYHRRYPVQTKTISNVGDIVVASRDGQYLAETDAITGVSTIRRVADDSVVASLPNVEVHGFSWDGGRVLVTPWQAGFLTVNETFQNATIIDWHSGKTVWSAPEGARFFGQMTIQPGGSAFALSLNFCRVINSCQESLWLVGADGKSRELDRDTQLLS